MSPGCGCRSDLAHDWLTEMFFKFVEECVVDSLRFVRFGGAVRLQGMWGGITPHHGQLARTHCQVTQVDARA